MDIWNDIELLDKLEYQRFVKRGTGRLTFDCMHAVVKGDRVSCSKGRLLGQARDGALALIMVLRGITSGACKSCLDYSAEEELE